MIDSTNPRIIANNIRRLFAKIIGLEAEIEAITPGSEVVPNPDGEASGELSSLGIDGDKYTIPTYTPPSYSTTEFNTGKKWIDGSDIYGRVIQSPGASINGWTSVATDAGFASIAQLIYGSYINTDNYGFYSRLNYKIVSNALQATAGTEEIVIPNGVYFYIEYIKTTPSSKKSKK